MATRGKKPKPSARRSTAAGRKPPPKAKPGKAPPQAPPGHRHKPLPKVAEALSGHLTWVAMKTVWAAAVAPDKFSNELREVKRHNDEWEALTSIRVPDEVRRWLAEHFTKEEEVYHAIRTQMELSMRHALPDQGEQGLKLEQMPMHLTKTKPAGPGGGGAGRGGGTQIDADAWPCCAPYCKPP